MLTRRAPGPLSVVLVLVLAACAGTPSASATAPASASPDPSPAASGSPDPGSSVAPSASASAAPAPPSWVALDVPGPAAREDHTWTLDPASGIAYLFGGRDGATVHGDTWAFDLATDTWTELAPPSSPDPRFGHEAVWHADAGLVIFSGQAGPTFFNDLWAFDPASGTWTELPAGGSPPTPRYGSCASVGPDGRIWVSHGFTQEGTRFADTRAYDVAAGTWTDETPPDAPRPVERCLHGCWWTDDGALALYAGQTTGATALDDRWRLEDGAWTQVDGTLPAARNLYARVRIEGATLVFGGQGVDGGYPDDLWLLADGTADAEPVEPAGTDRPAGRAGAELVLDADRGRALLFGGRTADASLADLWALDGVPSGPANAE